MRRLLCAFFSTLLICLLAAACSGGDSRVDAGQDAQSDADSDGGGDFSDTDDVDGLDGQDAGDSGPVPLSLEAVLPSRGPLTGGSWANIIGGGFVDGVGENAFDVRDVTAVRFGDNSAIDIEVIRDDMISVRTPAGLAGTCDVLVENPKGTVILVEGFTYFDTVTAYAAEPEDLSAEGGTSIQVLGTGFTEDTRLLISGRQAGQLRVHDSTRISAIAPPGEAGDANLEIINRNGRALLFHAVRYHDQPRIERLEPVSGPIEGGHHIAATGQNFATDDLWLLGEQAVAATTFENSLLWSLDTPAHAAGPVDAEVTNPVLSDRLSGAYVYLEAATGQLTLSAVIPGTGPADGGQEVQLVGDGLGQVEGVFFDDLEGTDLLLLDDRHLQVTTPAHAFGLVTVRIESADDSRSLVQAFRFFQTIRVDSLDPIQGPGQGGTPFSLTGEGFHMGLDLRFGGVPADALQLVSANELQGVTPAGSPGPVTLRLEDEDQRILLPEAFTYTSSLELLRVEPDNGAQAGGTYVMLYGSEFGNDMQVHFGDQAASLVQVFGPSVAAVRTPRGDPGEVLVRVARAGQEATLEAGFTYFDPTNDRGGASGGSIQGSLNVTVLDGGWATYGQPLPEATVVVEEPPISGITDDRGQVTFSGPSLVRAVTITAGKEGYQAITVADLNAANLSVYLTPNEQEPPDYQPGETKYSTISGRVFGFKDIPGLPTGSDIRYEARVTSTSYSIYSVPPYAGVPSGWPIEQDGGRFDFSVRLGTYNLYALYGAHDTSTDQFTPGLLGVRRDIVVPTENPVTDQDIILTTALDQAVEVTHIQAPEGFGENEATYGAYVSLDLGRNGIIHLSQAQGPGTQALLNRLPAASSNAFLFVGLASINGGYPLSYTFRRQEGDLSQGVNLGPYLGFTQITEPEMGAELVDGRIAWQREGPTPALIQLVIQTPDLFPKVLWRVILPGDATEIRLPEELSALLPQGEPLTAFIYTADSPRFEFDRFNYSQLSTSRWTSYSVNYTGFTMP
ncbi:MAG: IPT/TIG domain-containing protein [Deltaproteobacteria bacterium]|nr:IPT/TIG domain-containing protein [Deltaproteobacteria bacterium]